jgi:hypothetical protein
MCWGHFPTAHLGGAGLCVGSTFSSAEASAAGKTRCVLPVGLTSAIRNTKASGWRRTTPHLSGGSTHRTRNTCPLVRVSGTTVPMSGRVCWAALRQRGVFALVEYYVPQERRCDRSKKDRGFRSASSTLLRRVALLLERSWNIRFLAAPANAPKDGAEPLYLDMHLVVYDFPSSTPRVRSPHRNR